jgi:hypothetical protein
MSGEQTFIGLVAVTLGGLALSAAIWNWDWCYRLDRVRWVERRWGREWVRVLYALLGAGLIGLGVAIALGFSPNSSSRRHSRQTELLSDQTGRLHGLLDRSGIALR